MRWTKVSRNSQLYAEHRRLVSVGIVRAKQGQLRKVQESLGCVQSWEQPCWKHFWITRENTAFNLKQTPSYLRHLGGARKHVSRANPRSGGTEVTGLLFTWCFLTSSQKSPKTASYKDWVPTGTTETVWIQPVLNHLRMYYRMFSRAHLNGFHNSSNMKIN